LRYLITGGAGFIGSHLADALLARRHRVTVLDDLSTGALSNVTHNLDNPGFHFREGSVLDAPLVGQLVDEADVVVHLAAVVGVTI
jgi:UDP-glucose 4-epimerase